MSDNIDNPVRSQRPIRSYVLHQGRITPRQARALTVDWAARGLATADFKQAADWEQIFSRVAPRVLEIGFGMGDSLIEMARLSPEIDFLGVEVHRPGVGRCLARAQDIGLTNLKVFAEDVNGVLAAMPTGFLDKALLLFPDPWPKTKHHKRRIVQADFVTSLAEKIKKNGLFHLATDWQPYAEHMLAVLDGHPAWQNAYGRGHCVPDYTQRLQTKFEMRGKRLGHAISDLIYRRK